MSETPSVSEHVARVAALIKSGQLGDAKRETARLLDNVHPRVLNILHECAEALTRSNSVARPKLVALWQRSDETDRRIIEACAPTRDEWAHRQIPQPPADDRPRRTAPPSGPVHTRRSRPASRQQLRDRRRYTQARKDTAAYYDEHTGRFGVDDQPQRGDWPHAYALDYDKAALHATRGLDCVACWIERTRADHAPNLRHGDLFDDGLCTECRERGREGIPAISGPVTIAGQIAARCAFTATRYHPATARTLLTRDWEAVGPRVRVHMKAWIAANRELINAPAQGSHAPDVDPCACGSRRQVRHGQCADCRQLDTEPAAA